MVRRHGCSSGELYEQNALSHSIPGQRVVRRGKGSSTTPCGGAMRKMRAPCHDACPILEIEVLNHRTAMVLEALVQLGGLQYMAFVVFG